MATNYLLEKMPEDLHADLRTIAQRQHRTIKQVLLMIIDKEIERAMKTERTSKRYTVEG